MMQEALALDVVRDPGTALGASLDRYAGALTARLGGFGRAPRIGGPGLLSRLEARWSPGALTAGLIEVYDGPDFGPLVREWSVVSGYEGDDYRSEIPFVIPVDTADPRADLGGPRAARRPDRRAALRPVPVRQAPSTTPRPREQWRPVAGQRTLSPYPPALGRAGALESNLLRFPAARAEVDAGSRRALVEDGGEAGQSWAPPGQATHEDGRLADAIEARFSGLAPVIPIAAWLVAHDGPATGLAERTHAVAGRWTPASTLALPARGGDSPQMALSGSDAERTLVQPTAGTTSPMRTGDRPGSPGVLAARLEAQAEAARAPTPPAGDKPLISQGILPSPLPSADRPAGRIARLAQAAALEGGLPWRHPSPASPPFVPEALAGAAMAVGRAFEGSAATGWSALADGRTLVLPTAVTEGSPTRRPGAQRAPARAEQTTTGGRSAEGRSELRPLGAPGAAQPPDAPSPRFSSTSSQPASQALRALDFGLKHLADPPSVRAPGPVAADLPALARPFAAAAVLPETHREGAPATTVAPLTFGERLAALAARTEVDLGLTVAATPAGSLDAPWFAQDAGTLLLPLSASPEGAGARGDQRTGWVEARGTQVPVDRPPTGRVISLPPLAIAVLDRSSPPRSDATTASGAPRPASAAGAVLPLGAALNADLVVPRSAPSSGATRIARFVETVAPARAVAPAPGVAPASQRADRSVETNARRGAEATATPPTSGPAASSPGVGLRAHPALADFGAPATRRLAPTLGERLADVALVAFEVPHEATDAAAVADARAGRSPRPLELDSARGELVVAPTLADTPSLRAARAEAARAADRTAAARMAARTEAAHAEAARVAARTEAARTEAARTEAARTEAARIEATRAEAARSSSGIRPEDSRLISATSATASTALTAEAVSESTAANRLVWQRAARRVVDISVPAERVELFARWLQGEGPGSAALGALRADFTTRLEAAGILAPGARIQPVWQSALAELVATERGTAERGTTEWGPAERGVAERVAAEVGALVDPAAPGRLAPTPTASIAPVRQGITAWPAAMQRLIDVWQQAEATLSRGGTARAAGALPAATVPEATRESPVHADLPLTMVEGAPRAPIRTADRLPGTTALAAAGLGARLATRRFEDLLAAAPAARPMISPPARPTLPPETGRDRPSAVAAEGVRAALVQAGMASPPSEDFEVISSTSGFSATDLSATTPVWPALVAPAVGAEAALGATEEWAGSAAPGGRLAAPLNFERALLTWSAAAVRDAESRVAEQRPAQALGPLGQLVRQNATVMGPRTVDVAMRASTGGHLFGDRGPAGLVAPAVHAQRVLVDPGARAAEQALRSTPGERPARDTETSEEAQHRLSDQVGEEVSPEETERLAREIISRLKRELEFDAARMGDDAWD